MNVTKVSGYFVNPLALFVQLERPCNPLLEQTEKVPEQSKDMVTLKLGIESRTKHRWLLL